MRPDILVCGGRGYADKERAEQVLWDLNRKDVILGLIHGCATGADKLGADWMRERIKRDVAHCTENRQLDRDGAKRLRRMSPLWIVGCPAHWGDLETPPVVIRHGRRGPYNAAAGSVRNEFMLTWRPRLVLAFPGGPGTKDMVTRARRAGVEVLEIT